MTPAQLPPGWTRVPLADVADVIMGQSPPGSTYNSDGDGLPFFQGKAEFGPLHPTVSKWCSAPTKIAEPGDVLISVRAPVGPTNLADQRAAIGRGLAAIRPHAGLPGRYLLYALRASEHQLRDRATGTTFQAISGRVLREHSIGLAPAGKREEVVNAIEQQLTRLDVAHRWIERGRSRLMRLRRAIHRSAITGTSTPSDRHDWTSVALHELVSDQEGLITGPFGTLLSKSDHRHAGVAVVGIPNISERGLRLGGSFHVETTTADRLDRYQLRAGDLVISRSGSVGEVAVVPKGYGRALMSTNLMRIRPADPKLSDWLSINLRGSPIIHQQLVELLKGSTRPFLNLAILRQLTIRMPPADELRSIVARVARVETTLNDLDMQLGHALRRTERLRGVVLLAAFRGALSTGTSA